MVICCDTKLLGVVLTIICREQTHAQEDVIQEYIRRFTNRYDPIGRFIVQLLYLDWSVEGEGESSE